MNDHLIQIVVLEDFVPPNSLPKSNAYERNFDIFDNNKLKEVFHKINCINEILQMIMISLEYLTSFTKLLVK